MLIVVRRIQTAMRRRTRWKPELPRQPNQTTTLTTKQRRTQRVICWIGGPEKDDGGHLGGRKRVYSGTHPTGRTLDDTEASSLTAWAQEHQEVGKVARFSHRTWQLQTRDKLVQEVVRKTVFEKKPPRRDRNVRTPFRDKAKDHSTERATGAELKNALVATVADNLDIWRECQNPAPKDTPQSPAKSFFCQEMPLHSCIICHPTCCLMVRPKLGSNSDPKHPEFVGLILGSARGLTDTGAQQPVLGSSAAPRWCDQLLKRHDLVPVDVTPPNMIATCCGIGSTKAVQVLDFLAGIVGVSGVMRFLVLEEPRSKDGRRQFVPPLTPITITRQLGANNSNEGKR